MVESASALQVTMMRQCFQCGTATTYQTPGESPQWYHVPRGIICRRCYKLEWNKKRIYFTPLGKQVITDKIIVRTGVCSICGKSVAKEEISQTNLHHTEYDSMHPVANTIELCPRCHRRQHTGAVSGFCSKGHRLTNENLNHYALKHGVHTCRLCHNERERKYWNRKSKKTLPGMRG